MFIFILTRAYEQDSLLYFVNYQQRYRLEELQIVRDVFQKQERLLSKVYTAACMCVSILNTIFFLVIIFVGEGNTIKE